MHHQTLRNGKAQLDACCCRKTVPKCYLALENQPLTLLPTCFGPVSSTGRLSLSCLKFLSCIALVPFSGNSVKDAANLTIILRIQPTGK